MGLTDHYGQILLWAKRASQSTLIVGQNLYLVVL
jgi:hypothetical protein